MEHNRTTSGRLGRAVTVLAVVLAATGCTQVTHGVAVREQVVLNADGVDVDALDPGDFETRPAGPFGRADSVEMGTFLESARMAEFVVSPVDVDETLRRIDYRRTAMFTSPEAVEFVVTDVIGPPADIADAARRNGMVLGFAVGRSDPAGPTKLANAVLMFTDAASASAAAEEMNAATTLVTISRAEPNRPTSPQRIPGHDNTFGVMAKANGTQILTAYTAHGRFVLFQCAHAVATETVTDMVARTLDQQEPLIDRFEPTPVSDLPGLAIDPTGLLTRVVLDEERQASVQNIDFGPSGGLLIDPFAVDLADAFAAADVDATVTGQTTVYRTGQPAGGQVIVDAFIAGFDADDSFTPSAGVPELPMSRCYFEGPGPGSSEPAFFHCVAATGSYAFEGTRTDEAALHQLMAAQYLMLVA